MEYVGFAARIVLAAVFLVAGAAKFRDPAGVAASVANYRILPSRLVDPLARLLPIAEVALGLLLALGVLIVPVTVLSVLVLLAFAAAVEINLRRGRKIGCGCGFKRRQQISRRLVARNTLLAIGGVIAALAPSAALAVWPGPGTGSSTLTNDDGAALVVTVTAVMALGILALEVLDFQAARGRTRRGLAGR